MQTLIVLAHPDPRSFNAALAREVQRLLEQDGHRALLVDLYAQHFDPVLTLSELRQRFSLDDQVQQHIDALESSDLLVFVHPDWWGQPPALLKGWLDRVLRPGVAYEYQGEEFMTKHVVPLLTEKRALVLVTTNRPPEPDGELIELLWRTHILGFCGIRPVGFRCFYELFTSTHQQRRRWLTELEGVLTAVLQARDETTS